MLQVQVVVEEFEEVEEVEDNNRPYVRNVLPGSDDTLT